MELNDAEVTVLLDACLKNDSLVIADKRKLKKKGCIREVHSKTVTFKDAKRMEDFLSVVHSKMGTFKDAKCME